MFRVPGGAPPSANSWGCLARQEHRFRGGLKPAFVADGASPDDRFPLAGTLRLEMRATFVAAALEAVRISLGSSLGSAARDRRQ